MTGTVLSAPVVVGPSLLWYTTRATGVVALVLLTGTVLLGVVGSARAASARWPRIVTAELHRNLALTAAAFVAIHVITTLLDPFAPIGLAAVVIPFASSYRPFWLSLGTVAFDLLAAVLITSLLRDRLRRRTWQVVHLLVYACWPVALWHGLGTGTDSRLPWVLGIDVICLAAVGWAVWWRLSFTEHSTARTVGRVSLAAFPLLTLVFVAVGPMQPGWARRAGTPAALTRSAATAGTGSVGTGSASTGSASTGTGVAAGRLASARFTGRVAVADAAGQRTITITGRTVAAPAQSFVIVLHGTPAGQGISLTSGTVRIGAAGSAGGYTGQVTGLSGQRLTAKVSGPGGERHATFILTITGSSVTGTVSLLGDA
ncbi:MAG: ferric reductase-like transmembrane domain-containing protein [Actinomycetota bacterium]|nr:ferric reductase-like transmembrane domain-containing protein [Actinomycetota bacterium]